MRSKQSLQFSTDITVKCQDPDSSEICYLDLEVTINHKPSTNNEDLVYEHLEMACQVTLDTAFSEELTDLIFTKKGRTSTIDSKFNPFLKDSIQAQVSNLTIIQTVDIKTPIFIQVKHFTIKPDCDVKMELAYIKSSSHAKTKTQTKTQTKTPIKTQTRTRENFNLSRGIIEEYINSFTVAINNRNLGSLVETFGREEIDDVFDQGLYLGAWDTGLYVIIRAAFKVSSHFQDRIVARYQKRQLDREIDAFYSRTPVLGVVNTLFFKLFLARQKTQHQWYSKPSIRQCNEYHYRTSSHTWSSILSIVTLLLTWMLIGPLLNPDLSTTICTTLFVFNYVLFGIPGIVFLMAL